MLAPLSVWTAMKCVNIYYLFSPQYVIYDFNGFVADVGGYMGLVLGIRELHDSYNLLITELEG